MKILAKLTILGLLIGFLGIQASEAPSSLQKEQNEQSFPIGALPEELQIMIFENIIPGSSSLEDAVQKIKSFMLINRQYANYLDDEATTKRIIEALAEKWTNKDWDKAALYLGTKHAQAMIRKAMQEEQRDENGAIMPENAVKWDLYNKLLQAAKDGDLVVLNAIVALGLNVNRRYEQNVTPLMLAASQGHLAGVRYLVEHGATIDLKNELDETALLIAVAKKKNDVATFLISSGADPNSVTTYGLTPLLGAINHCDIQIFNASLAKGANLYLVVSQPGPFNGYNAIMLASRVGCTVILKELLKDPNFNVNAQNAQGQTALFLASLNGHDEIVKELLAAGARVDLQDSQGFSALHVAANKGNANIVEALIRAGANVNLPSAQKFTPLFASIVSGNKNIVELLLNAKADMYAKTADGNDVLFQAAGGGNVEIVNLLLERGFNPNGSNPKDHSPLTLAANHGHLEMMKLLIARGADVGQASEDKLTPLLGGLLGSADMETKQKITALLLAADANPNTTINVDGLGQNLTPLFVAINLSNQELVKKLLAAGANINAVANMVTNREGNIISNRTPLMYAIQVGEEIPMIKLLLDAKADTTLKDNLGQTAYRLAQALSISRASDSVEQQARAGKMKEVVALLESYGIRE